MYSRLDGSVLWLSRIFRFPMEIGTWHEPLERPTAQGSADPCWIAKVGRYNLGSFVRLRRRVSVAQRRLPTRPLRGHRPHRRGGDGPRRVIVIASFHLVHHRRRRVRRGRPPHTPGLKFWRSLSTDDDFTTPHPGFARTVLAPPALKRLAFFGVWEDENALQDFMNTSHLVREWAERGDEAWHLWLKPIRSTGTWHQTNPLEGCDRTNVSESPVAVLTRGDVRIPKLPAFWLLGARLARDVRQAPGFIAGVAMTERSVVEVATFTVWRSLDDATNFAYQRRAHAEVVARNHRERIMKVFFSAYFHSYHSEGTWHGGNPAPLN